MAAHRTGVIHRDLGPSNIFLCSTNTEIPLVKILDFSLARPMVPGDEESSNLTTAGTLMGKPGYVAPEMFLEQPLDARSDIFGCGMMLFRMLAGRLPFRNTQQQTLWVERFAEIRSGGELPSLINFASWIPPALEKVVMQALRTKPDERYPRSIRCRRTCSTSSRSFRRTGRRAARCARRRCPLSPRRPRGASRPRQAVLPRFPARARVRPACRAARACRCPGSGRWSAWRSSRCWWSSTCVGCSRPFPWTAAGAATGATTDTGPPERGPGPRTRGRGDGRGEGPHHRAGRAGGRVLSATAGRGGSFAHELSRSDSPMIVTVEAEATSRSGPMWFPARIGSSRRR